MRIRQKRERAFYLYKKPVVWPGSSSSTNGRTLEQDQSRLPSFYLINTECPLFLIGKTFFNKQNRLSLYFVYQPPGIDGFCNKAARRIIGPIRHALLEKEASEKMQKENPVECEIIKASHFHSSFYSVARPRNSTTHCELGERWVSVPWLLMAFDACSFLGKKAVGNVSHV